jgi:dihydroorotase
MKPILIANARIVNEGRIFEGDVLIENGLIARIGGHITAPQARTIDAKGQYLLPGIIDDQVHFREPGLTHKANIFTESRAAVAGGVTSFMEMPNTNPQTLTQALLEEKYQIGARTALANYSFFMGVSNDNLEEAVRTDPARVCGLKIFMGSSTGNMLVDRHDVLENIFSRSELLIATHCEDEPTVKASEAAYRERFGDGMPMHYHAEIRGVDACYKSSSMAIGLAKKHGTRLHILHISTAEETELFDNTYPLEEKRITSEACVHHLWFDRGDYDRLGAGIKCNPAIKEARHKEAVFQALLDNRIDIIATDHAPHTVEEKGQSYWKAPSGLPLVQHTLNVMLEFYHQGRISLERIVEKMCHAPAVCFQVSRRGFIREGYWADLALLDLSQSFTVDKAGLHYKCGWSPFEGHTFRGKVTHTIVSGHLAYANGAFDESKMGERMLFAR